MLQINQTPYHLSSYFKHFWRIYIYICYPPYLKFLSIYKYRGVWWLKSSNYNIYFWNNSILSGYKYFKFINPLNIYPFSLLIYNNINLLFYFNSFNLFCFPFFYFFATTYFYKKLHIYFYLFVIPSTIYQQNNKLLFTLNRFSTNWHLFL